MILATLLAAASPDQPPMAPPLQNVTRTTSLTTGATTNPAARQRRLVGNVLSPGGSSANFEEWRSIDHGATWTYVETFQTGGTAGDAIWEPFLTALQDQRATELMLARSKSGPIASR